MANTKNALLRTIVIDRCLSDKSRWYSTQDIIEEFNAEQCDTIAEKMDDIEDYNLELDKQLDSIHAPTESLVSSVSKQSKLSSRSGRISR